VGAAGAVVPSGRLQGAAKWAVKRKFRKKNAIFALKRFKLLRQNKRKLNK
jgi:hypothetical protein